ncbi:MAG: CarD family transcriptional regulator [Clostridia bacterium]|nr:CarD family transcriptional regulator [Clostridia bacterium]
MFTIGDCVAYPMHGAGRIAAMEVKNILGEERRYFVLQFPTGDMRVLVPVDSAQESGLRAVIPAEEGHAVLASLSVECPEETTNWNRRYRENLEKMRTGDIYDVAGVVRSLTVRDRTRGLSTGERKMLVTAVHILASELILSLGLSEAEVLDLIEHAV